MSRVGNLPITIPGAATVDISKGNLVTVKGPKGTLTEQLSPELKFNMDDGELTIDRPTNQNRHKSLHGLSRALIHNMVVGVTDGYERELELIGVGYRVANTGNLLELTVGYSHPIFFYIPDEIKLETKMEKGSRPSIKLVGIDKQLLGQVAAKIRAFRKPEPYKGKGIRYKGEYVRSKQGKTAAK